MGEREQPPQVFGEVWRGKLPGNTRGDLYAVALQGCVSVRRWDGACWVTPVVQDGAFVEWAMAERARAEKAERVITGVCQIVCADPEEYAAMDPRDAVTRCLLNRQATIDALRAEVARLTAETS